MNDRRVIVVAGATGAVGQAVSHSLLQAGHRVALFYRRDSVPSGYGRFGSRCFPQRADLSRAKDVEAAVQRVLQHFGRIDALVNAAGGWIGGKPLHEHTPEELERMLSIDLYPAFNLMRAVLPSMLDAGTGKIINFASLSALQGGAHSAVYAASKNAVVALARAAAEEYRSKGIQIYCLAPSIIDTEANRQAMPNADHRKWVSLKEITETVAYLLDSEAGLSGTLFILGGK